MAAQPATSYDEIKDVLRIIAEENSSQEKVLVPARSVQTWLKIEKDKEVSIQTIREYGITMDGYFVKKYPRIFSYQKVGDPKNWGLVMKPGKYLEEVIGKKVEA